MSGSSIADGLVATLRSSSAFDTNQVTKSDYGILERTGSIALVVQPDSFLAEEHAYGTRLRVTWSLAVEAYIRDTGDPVTTLNNLWFAADEIIRAVQADEKLSSSACKAVVRRGIRPRDTFVEAGGVAWVPYYFTVEAMEVI